MKGGENPFSDFAMNRTKSTPITIRLVIMLIVAAERINDPKNLQKKKKKKQKENKRGHNEASNNKT